MMGYRLEMVRSSDQPVTSVIYVSVTMVMLAAAMLTAQTWAHVLHRLHWRENVVLHAWTVVTGTMVKHGKRPHASCAHVWYVMF